MSMVQNLSSFQTPIYLQFSRMIWSGESVIWVEMAFFFLTYIRPIILETCKSWDDRSVHSQRERLLLFLIYCSGCYIFCTIDRAINMRRMKYLVTIIWLDGELIVLYTKELQCHWKFTRVSQLHDNIESIVSVHIIFSCWYFLVLQTYMTYLNIWNEKFSS